MYVWGRFQCPSCFFVVLCPNWGRPVFTTEKQDLLPPTNKFEEKLSFLSFRDYLFWQWRVFLTNSLRFYNQRVTKLGNYWLWLWNSDLGFSYSQMIESSQFCEFSRISRFEISLDNFCPSKMRQTQNQMLLSHSVEKREIHSHRKKYFVKSTLF